MDTIIAIHKSAFGQDDEELLTINLLEDPSAAPRISSMAILDGKPAGHILFTRVAIVGAHSRVTASILAPLAVATEFQRKGVGGELIRHGLQRLHQSGDDLLFVLGHPEYYPRFGFQPAGAFGLHTPYRILAQHADAWTVLELKENILGSFQRGVLPAESLQKPESWQE